MVQRGQSGLEHPMQFTRLLASALATLILVLPSVAQKTPDISIDYGAFAFDASESMVEIYMAIGAASLQYENAERGYQAILPVGLSLWRSTDAALEGTPDSVVWEREIDLAFSVRDTSTLEEGQVFIRQIRVTIPPGEYELRASVLSPDGDRLDAERDLIIPDFAQHESCVFSDITLASTITRSDDREDAFHKNGLSILPNASQLYGMGASSLFYYAEAYNLACAASDGGEYTLLTYVSEANQAAPLPGLQKRSVRQARDIDVLVGSFDVKSLPSGTYFLRFVILNEANEALVEQSRKFFVFNPSVASATAAAQQPRTVFETSGYATMPEEEVSQGLEHARVIATEQETRRIRRMSDLEAQRRFLMEFWQVRDPSPETEENEFRNDFYSRLMYANERYSIRNREGWETDRGQVLVKYGRPTSIEPHLYDSGFKPYEIWVYNSIPGEGEAQFVFADLDGFGDFELVHSTVIGERKLANWLEELANIY